MKNLLVSVGHWKVWDAGSKCVSLTHEECMDSAVTVGYEEIEDLMDTLRIFITSNTTEIVVK